MRTALTCCSIVALAALAAACNSSRPADTRVATTSVADSASRDSAAHLAHEHYVTAINSNDIDTLTSMMTDDVVFLAANEKPLIGKAAVRAWAVEYLKAFRTKWDKPVKEFVVSGDYAFERYDYTSTDTPVAGGKNVVDTGWGLVIYHREPDGVWRVARDAFGPDHHPGGK